MEKQKRHSALRQISFVLVWSISLAAVGFLARVFTTSILAPLLPTDQTLLLSRLISLLIPALLQVQLVERLLKRPMRGWMLYTLPGILITILLMELVRFFLPAPVARFDPYLLLSTLAFIVPAPVLQGLWLRQRVHKAWLWPTAALLTALVFSAFPSDGSNPHLLWLILTLLYGVIQGTVMHALWQHPKDIEKAKVDFDVADDTAADQHRIERLQTSEHLRTSPWPYADEAASQQKSQ